MVERREQLRIALEAGYVIKVKGAQFGRNLQGDIAI